MQTLLQFLRFYGFEEQGPATADLLHGNRVMSLYSFADGMLVLIKKVKSSRSEIILIVIVAGDVRESGFYRETVNCMEDFVLYNTYPAYFR